MVAIFKTKNRNFCLQTRPSLNHKSSTTQLSLPQMFFFYFIISVQQNDLPNIFFINKKLSIPLLNIHSGQNFSIIFLSQRLKSLVFILNLLFTTFHFTQNYFGSIEMPSILSTILQNKGIKVDINSNFIAWIVPILLN